MAFEFGKSTFAENAVPVVGGAASNIVLSVLCAVTMNAGRGWARWVYGILYSLGIPLYVISILIAPHVFLSSPALTQFLVVLQLTLQTAVIVLMFAPASREWFKRPYATPASNT
jgi:hypothetical protein